MSTTDQRQIRQVRDMRVSPADNTTGGTQRLTRALRSSPRDEMHMRDDYGTTMDDPTYTALEENRVGFENAVTARRAEIDKDTEYLNTESVAAKKTLDAQRAEALGAIPNPTSVDGEYNKWKSTWHTFQVVEPLQGKNIGSVQVPGEVAHDFARIMTDEGMPVTNNVIRSTGNFNVPFQAAEHLQDSASATWYENAGPAILEGNNKIAAAKTNVQNQYIESLNELNADIASAQGRLEGATQGLDNEILARDEDLASIRTSYEDRIGRINEALQMTVGQQQAQSQSAFVPPKPLSPKVSTAQEQPPQPQEV